MESNSLINSRYNKAIGKGAGIYVYLDYKIKYSNGSALEHFILYKRESSDDFHIFSYNVELPNLPDSK